MQIINDSKLLKLRKDYPSGTKVKLIKMEDPQAPKPGTYGIVNFVDDIGTIMVNWENGSTLGVVYNEDIIEK